MMCRVASNDPKKDERTGCRTLVAGVGVLVVTIALAACDSSSGGSSGSPTAPSGNVTTIAVLGERGSQSFTPNPASPGGRSVVWRNDDGVIHRIVANDGSFDVGDVAPGATSAMVQIPPEGINYHCSLHPTTMFGSINGSGGAPAPPCEIYCE